MCGFSSYLNAFTTFSGNSLDYINHISIIILYPFEVCMYECMLEEGGGVATNVAICELIFPYG